MIDGKAVVYAVEGAKNGCNFYRIKQPYSLVSENNLFACATSSMLKDLEEQSAWTDKADVIVSQIGTSEKFLDYISECKGKKKFILDYDDNIFDVSPYNPSYQMHGVSEVVVNMDGNSLALWKDGERGFDINENRSRISLFIETLKAVDLVTTPSPRLANVFRSHGAKNVRVVRNMVNLDDWKPVNLVKDGFVRIGYQGGWSHFEDWLLIKEPLTNVMLKYPNVKLVIMGQHYPGALKDIPSDRIEVKPWADVQLYPWVFKTLNIDIGIAPLAESVFNECKSEIKWVEYGALGIPCVASNFGPYAANISHRGNGFLAASDGKDWERYISNLVEDSELRRHIGQAASRKVEEDYDIKKGVTQYENAIRSLFRKEVLVLH